MALSAALTLHARLIPNRFPRTQTAHHHHDDIINQKLQGILLFYYRLLLLPKLALKTDEIY